MSPRICVGMIVRASSRIGTRALPGLPSVADVDERLHKQTKGYPPVVVTSADDGHPRLRFAIDVGNATSTPATAVPMRLNNGPQCVSNWYRATRIGVSPVWPQPTSTGHLPNRV